MDGMSIVATTIEHARTTTGGTVIILYVVNVTRLKVKFQLLDVI
jgi:hypothetical protein